MKRHVLAKVLLGIGSNVGNRLSHLEGALGGLKKLSQRIVISSLYETPALLTEGAPKEWNRPYFNAVVEIETSLAPLELLQATQALELASGRIQSQKWAPRTLDIDLLFFEGCILDGSDLILPHPRVQERSFVLDPLAEIYPEFKVQNETAKNLAKKHPQHQARLMGILNLTPDSFSDGGRFKHENTLSQLLDRWDEIGISFIDLGAESTRPASDRISLEEEWRRLEPTLILLKKRYQRSLLRPRISLDTFHPETAERALDYGTAVINDVSGLASQDMLKLLSRCSVDYILMHSLSIPPNHQNVLPESMDPVQNVKKWFHEKLKLIDEAGISRNRLILDPGIGFGKTSLQSLTLLQRFKELQSFQLPLLAGHSRKKFLADWSPAEAGDRDLETLGVSFALLTQGVDILRVHDPVAHHRAFLSARHVALPRGDQA